MFLRPSLRTTPIGDTAACPPDRRRPVRGRARPLPAYAHLDPGCHPGSQRACCAGVVQVTTRQGEAGDSELTCRAEPRSLAKG